MQELHRLHIPLQGHVLECAGKCGGRIHGIGDVIGGEHRVERGETFIRKREPGVIVMDGRIEQDLGMRLKVCKGGVVVQVVVEDLHHNI